MEICAPYSDTLEAGVSKTSTLAIDAGAIFTPQQKISPARLVTNGTKIAAVGSPDSVQIPTSAERIDAADLFVTPGFIDPHIHGCGGADVMDGTYEALNAISRLLVRHGTTSYLPTTVSSPPDILIRAVEQIGASISEQFDGATPLGIHLEGPFISPTMRGTHKASNVLAPSIDLLDKCIRGSNDNVRLLTVAPELEGIDALLIFAKHFGVTLAMGHSNATFAQSKAAIGQGVCYAVHTFNAMRPLLHREPGITGAILSDDRVFAEIIADGIHVDDNVVRIFARSKGESRVLLVTDAISATDMPDGSYRLGADTVSVVNGTCRNAEGRLAGSTLTQEVALRNFVRWTEWPFERVLPALTLNPAKALRLENKGVLEPGADADIVALDRDFRVMKTIVAGRLVFDRGTHG
jgi:N-acetylglucosamine-6-phosphate deacetylase